MKGLGSEEFSDLEASIEKENNLGRVDLLKQMVTDPDFATRE